MSNLNISADRQTYSDGTPVLDLYCTGERENYTRIYFPEDDEWEAIAATFTNGFEYYEFNAQDAPDTGHPDMDNLLRDFAESVLDGESSDFRRWPA